MSRFTAEERIGIYKEIIPQIEKYGTDMGICIYLSAAVNRDIDMMIHDFFPEFKKYCPDYPASNSFSFSFHSFYNNLIPSKFYTLEERNAHRISVLKSMIEDARKEVGK